MSPPRVLDGANLEGVSMFNVVRDKMADDKAERLERLNRLLVRPTAVILAQVFLFCNSGIYCGYYRSLYAFLVRGNSSSECLLDVDTILVVEHWSGGPGMLSCGHYCGRTALGIWCLMLGNMAKHIT